MEEESSSVPFLHRLPSIPAADLSAAFPSSSTHAFPNPTMRFCGWASACGIWFRAFLRNYDTLQAAAVFLLCIQIGCAMVGSLGAMYNGVLVMDLAVALFALVAIESSSQSLGRTYAVLLLCVIVLDVLWFILFSHDVWSKSSSQCGTSVVFSVRLALSMEIVGFSARLLSLFLWIQMYRLGPYRLNKQHQIDVAGFESSSESPQFKICLSRSFQVFNEQGFVLAPSLTLLCRLCRTRALQL